MHFPKKHFDHGMEVYTMNVLKVSSKSNANSVAGALAAAIRDYSEAELQAVGAGAVNQSVKAVAIASGFLAPSGIMLYLIRHGLENKLSFDIMEAVRKGKGVKPEWEEEMLKHDVPEWYIASCKKIKYMFPKAHAAAYVMSAIRLAWYKIYYPMEFYAAYFTVAPGGFDGDIVMRGRGAVSATIEELSKKPDATQKEAETVTALSLAREALARGVVFLPVDLYKSDATAFLPENGKIRLPFAALGGLGEGAAQKIVEARADGEFFSIEELRERAKLNKSVIEILSQSGALKNLSETNQYTFF